MQKNKISKEEALSHYYQYYKYNRFTYNHVTYDSFAACCMAYEIKPICVRRYAKRKHLGRMKGMLYGDIPVNASIRLYMVKFQSNGL
jgi:hypothetical protein